MRLFTVVSLFGVLIAGDGWSFEFLHVGDLSFPISDEKKTYPSINLQFENNEINYVSLLPVHISNSLHIEYQNKVYSAYDISNFYDIRNGQLLSASEDISVQGLSGVIDTGFYPNQDTRVVAKYTNSTLNKRLWVFHAGNYYGWQNFSNSVVGLGMYYNSTRYLYGPGGYLQNQTVWIDMDKNSLKARCNRYPNWTTKTAPYVNFQSDATLQIFPGTTDNTWFKIYYLKIYDNGVLVRDFVPVFAGLQIGDFVVPQNGMFDIVEQRFYAPTGGTLKFNGAGKSF
ncbi:MAG: hypothetical protein K6B71_03160 [Alphaproteobacteria bacterium]|nr:hypothetical protein [Alphaproteobacteria bacterium]